MSRFSSGLQIKPPSPFLAASAIRRTEAQRRQSTDKSLAYCPINVQAWLHTICSWGRLSRWPKSRSLRPTPAKPVSGSKDPQGLAAHGFACSTNSFGLLRTVEVSDSSLCISTRSVSCQSPNPPPSRARSICRTSAGDDWLVTPTWRQCVGDRAPEYAALCRRGC
ncbi:hypothetical protein C8J57DRAFT_335527 [Mycena rebaudengoi]|nr:hypothetical protein C8J57DRAFT_335527 [Mycena rebaudengoi]